MVQEFSDVLFDYKNLETIILTGKEIKITFLPDDKIKLMMDVEEWADHVIRISTSWGEYILGRYDNEASAKSDFDKFHEYLKIGYPVHITSNYHAEIIIPDE